MYVVIYYPICKGVQINSNDLCRKITNYCINHHIFYSI